MQRYLQAIDRETTLFASMFYAFVLTNLRKRLWTISAVAATVAIFLQVNSVAFVSVLFSANQQEIVATKCERKIPHCNGRCFLKKEMKAATEETGNATTSNERGNHVPSISSEYVECDYEIPPIHPTAVAIFSLSSANPIAGFSAAIFNPPRCA